MLASLSEMRRSLLSITALVLLLALPQAASASGQTVIQDCAVNGRLTRAYTRAELRDASQHLPADLAEYSNCPGVIEAALRAASVPPAKKTPQKTPGNPNTSLGAPAGSGPRSGGGGAGASPSPSSSPDATRVPPIPAAPTKRHPKVLAAGGPTGATAPVAPADASRASSGLDALPTPLLVLLIVLLLGATAGGVVSVRRRRLRPGADVLRRGT